MAKLTLSVDDHVVSNAKRYAKLRGVSVSEIVETYLAAVAAPAVSVTGSTPILHSVRGVLRNAEVSEYRQHLAAKYR